MAKNIDDLNDKLKTAMGVKTSKPKITVNKLGEFIIANPARQRRILEQLKYPKDNSFGFGYEGARDAIKDYLIKEMDDSCIDDCVAALELKDPRNEWQEGQIDSSIEVLRMVQDTALFEDLKMEFSAYAGDNPKMIIKGVSVSVYPDLIVKSEYRGEHYIGGMKIHFSRTNPVGEEGAKYIAAILHQFTERNLTSKKHSAKPSNSLSYDVWTESLVSCPKAVKRRWDDIEASCLNIAAIWESI